MGTPLKVKLRRFLKELKCPHKSYISRGRGCGNLTFVECECVKCGKVWIE